jgi:hypothetical protein
MAFDVEELAEVTAQRENLIETKYLGKEPKLKGTTGEAYLDLGSNQWKYRPFKQTVKFYNVAAKELDCANDSGWVKGEYFGPRPIGLEGKAYWSEGEDAWVYKPKGQQRTFVIPEKEFKMRRDEDVFDK